MFAGTYQYDAWGKILNLNSLTAIAKVNPFRYRGYYYDTESNLYYLNSRYYNPEWGRFINADGQLIAGSNATDINLFAYCSNNPTNRVDSEGQTWYHWAIAAAIVVGCGVATVVTCGGFAAAAGAICMVGSGMAAATTASTVAAGAFIGSATVFGMSAITAAGTSSTVKEFNSKGNWGTVAGITVGAFVGGYNGYTMSKAQTPKGSTTRKPQSTGLHTSGVGNPNNNINPGGSYTKLGNNGNLYSYTKFDDLGRQTMRIDYQGRPHAGVLPHIHMFVYPQQGGKVEYIFNLNWDLIN